ncbi:Y-family DNA polymerase [Prochlorococcus sp. MIT 1223]|uniref:Y-family DNA polymerase n=1 Tax=Prochlorococcus sp. MIT 1223 TaxID=3096217 RepID=UPI002A764485|nr:DUF4113 domain-containing protein [Prochlorococcus sp. MIT 1223]
MTKFIALIDGNNFYASCEQMINPALSGKPVIVLSNNDGCIISRSAEARELNIKMGQPYFKIANTVDALGINVCSSNYSLYGDMSNRLMSLIEERSEKIEVYSIDEAFVQISHSNRNNLIYWAQELRAIVQRNIGLTVAIGIGKNKVQAKIANYLSKELETHAGIFNICMEDRKDTWLERVDVEKIWGIGTSMSSWCRRKGINNAKQFRDMSTNLLKAKYGVIGIRIQEELRGNKCINLLTKQSSKKETCVSRSLKKPIINKAQLKQVIASHIILASAKLRKQKQLTGSITIFARTSLYNPNFHSRSASKKLNVPCNNTNTLIKISLSLIDEIYSENCRFTKTGVIMQKLQGIDFIQLCLNNQNDIDNFRRQEVLMKTIDNLNMRYGKDTIKWCISFINKGSHVNHLNLSPAASTRFKEIGIARA